VLEQWCGLRTFKTYKEGAMVVDHLGWLHLHQLLLGGVAPSERLKTLMDIYPERLTAKTMANETVLHCAVDKAACHYCDGEDIIKNFHTLDPTASQTVDSDKQ
jgi:hypothetical protein